MLIFNKHWQSYPHDILLAGTLVRMHIETTKWLNIIHPVNTHIFTDSQQTIRVCLN